MPATEQPASVSDMNATPSSRCHPYDLRVASMLPHSQTTLTSNESPLFASICAIQMKTAIVEQSRQRLSLLWYCLFLHFFFLVICFKYLFEGKFCTRFSNLLYRDYTF
jgi:hypothetical protein